MKIMPDLYHVIFYSLLNLCFNLFQLVKESRAIMDNIPSSSYASSEVRKDKKDLFLNWTFVGSKILLGTT